jgi:hypothetical protein
MTDEPGAIWAEAAQGNFRSANRPQSEPIEYVVIHDIEGTAEGAVRWFQNPVSQVSAHYVVDAVRGRIWQQVREKDVGYHAGNRNINARSIGIEHEGYAYRPGFFTQTLYETSARLVRHITARHNIPRDRTHIIGHFEVPSLNDPTKRGGAGGHTDPGPYWDWDYYMTLIRNDAGSVNAPSPVTLRPGESAPVVIMLQNTGDDPWPSQTKAVLNEPLQTRGPVYLGTATGNASPLFGAAWVSPRYAAPPLSDVAPGQTADFAVSPRAPLAAPAGSENAPALMVEMFRLVKVLPAPRAPVPFGPTVAVSVLVKPWQIDWPATVAPSIAPPAPDAPVTRANVEQDLAPARPANPQAKPGAFTPAQTNAPAQWTGSLPVAGVWRLQVVRPSKVEKSGLSFAITNAGKAEGLGSDGNTISKTRAGEYVTVGQITVSDPKSVTVRLLSPDYQFNANKTKAVPTLRWVGPFAP